MSEIVFVWEPQEQISENRTKGWLSGTEEDCQATVSDKIETFQYFAVFTDKLPAVAVARILDQMILFLASFNLNEGDKHEKKNKIMNPDKKLVGACFVDVHLSSLRRELTIFCESDLDLNSLNLWLMYIFFIFCFASSFFIYLLFLALLLEVAHMPKLL